MDTFYAVDQNVAPVSFNVHNLTNDLINMKRHTPLLAHRLANVKAVCHDHDYCIDTMPILHMERINSVTDFEILRIEKRTRQQSANSLWHKIRNSRITASICHNIVQTTKAQNYCVSYARNHILNKPINSAAIKWGKSKEKLALEEHNNSQNVKFQSCGIFIDKVYNFLAASPDGINSTKTKVIEIKCPYSIRTELPENASYIEFGKLKRNHPYYTQVQVQMHVTGVHLCDFVVWTTKGTLVDEIKYDADFMKISLQFIEMYFKKCFAPTYVELNF